MKLVTMVFAALVGLSGNVLAADVSAGKSVSATCAACHGVDGNAPSDLFPKLAGQHAEDLEKQILDFQNGARENAMMAPMVAALSAEQVADVSAYFATQKTTPGAVSEDLVALGEKIYRGGNKETGVPACMACHGPDGSGVPAAKWPALSGQYPAYLEAQLAAFASGARSNDANKMMQDIASRMSDAEMKAAAAYASGL